MIVDETADKLAKIALVEERVSLEKRSVETGRVQIATRVEERSETVRDLLIREDVAVERIPIGRIVDAAPQPRQEGLTWIIPIVEETLVVEKRFLLKEEVHVIRTSRV